jgi:hypothetical protein
MRHCFVDWKEVTCGICSSTLSWCAPCLSNRTKYMSARDQPHRSRPESGMGSHKVQSSAPLFSSSTKLISLARASDAAYVLTVTPTTRESTASAPSPPSETTELHNRLVTCIEDVAAWTNVNRLQLNSAKTEFLWSGSRRRKHQLPTTQPLVICHTVLPSTVVGDRGVWIESGLTMSPHITKVVTGNNRAASVA